MNTKRSRTKLRALLFDLDGTLTDPFDGISRCYRFALERLNVEVDPQFDFRSWIGPPMHDAFAAVVEPHRIPEAISHYRERYGTHGLYENVVYDGIASLLADMRSRARLFVCTSKPAFFAEQILRHFDLYGYFEGVYGSELDGRYAHKPQLLARLLQEQHIAGADAVMIGDRRHDVVAALENGVTAYGAAWGYGTIEELRGAGAHAIFDTPDELKAALR